jgi:hypothetical protein
MIPFQSRRLRLMPAGRQDRRWLAAAIDRASRPFGSRVELAPGGALVLGPALAAGHGQAQRWG